MHWMQWSKKTELLIYPLHFLYFLEQHCRFSSPVMCGRIQKNRLIEFLSINLILSVMLTTCLTPFSIPFCKFSTFGLKINKIKNSHPARCAPSCLLFIRAGGCFSLGFPDQSGSVFCCQPISWAANGFQAEL